jgi:hypothetical protein
MVVYKDEENISMDDFKTYVRRWFELDNYVKKAQEVIKEKRGEKCKLSEVIMKFMCKYNIEDLNTKEGRIRCKNTYVKAPVNKQLVQQRISDMFVNDEDKRKEIIEKIYEDREKVEKTTLRRLRIT